MTWAEVRDAWDQGWTLLWDEGMELWESAIEASPTEFYEAFSRFYGLLNEVRTRLDHIKTLASGLPPEEAAEWSEVTQTLETQWANLAAGLYADAWVTDGSPQMGAVPILLVGTIAFGVSAVAWAVVAYEYLDNLDQQSRVVEQELLARVELTRQGLALPASTLPGNPTPPPDELFGNLTQWMLGGLLLLGFATVLPTVLNAWNRSNR